MYSINCLQANQLEFLLKYANEMLMRLDRSLDEHLSLIIFVKLRSRFNAL